MSSSFACPLPRDLPDGLLLRQATSAQDVEAVLACHVVAFGDEDRLGIEWHLRHRPGARLEDILLIEDPRSGQVVSSINLARETWLYEGLSLRVAEAGIVGTRPAYRGRGLVSAQFDAFHALALRAGCPLTIIAGIPYFYRQFGYDYAVPMDGGLRLPAERIPAESPYVGRYPARPATPDDAETLVRLYREAIASQGVAADLTSALWRYQDGLPPEADDRQETYVLERAGAPCGFWRMHTNETSFYCGACLNVAHLPEEEMAWQALHFARNQALTAKADQTVTVRGPEDSTLMRLMASLGAERRRGYGWYVRVGDPVALMMAIAPALERRLQASSLAGYDGALTMDLYREGLALRFRSGRLLSVALTASDDHAHVRMPPEVAPLLWFGRRSLEDLLGWYPDVRAKDAVGRELAETLFPPRPAFVLSLF